MISKIGIKLKRNSQIKKLILLSRIKSNEKNKKRIINKFIKAILKKKNNIAQTKIKDKYLSLFFIHKSPTSKTEKSFNM